MFEPPFHPRPLAWRSRMDLHQLQSTLGDGYTIEHELGGGGMSRVFVAMEAALGRKVVVKVLPTETAGQVSIDRFRREIRVAASLQQANIVPVLSAGDAGGVAYYTMPFVRGESLRARLLKSAPLPTAECLAILRDVAKALAYAHGEGIVHRDIKPENILLSGGTAVVTDFGIAKAVAASQTQPHAMTLTQAGLALGTPAYMSPEQAVGESAIDNRADLYSWGIIAYELFTTSPPFVGRSLPALLVAHATETPVAIGEHRPDLSAALAQLVMQCLEKEPDRRPQTAEEILATLDAVTTPSSAIVASADYRVQAKKPAIAVLPIRNLSTSADDEYFSDGITEDIIAQLSQVASLKVIARTSVMQYKRTDKTVRTIGRELGVSHIVDGSIRRAANRLRIVAQLIEVASEAPIWAETFDRELTDVFAVQSEVAERITAALESKLTTSERDRIVKRAPAVGVDAYDAYLRGRFEYNKGTADAYRKAVEHFERAIVLEPTFAQPHVGAAEALCYLALFFDDPHALFPRATSHVSKALELNDQLPEAYAMLAYVNFWYDWKWAEAERLLKQALDLQPNSAVAHSYCAGVFANLGRYDEAVAHAREAVSLDPLWPYAHHILVFSLYMAAAFDEAIRAAERALDLSPDSANILIVKAFAHLELRDYGTALDLLRRALATSPGASIAMATLVQTQARMGDLGAARRTLAEMHATSSQRTMQPSALAWAHCALGEVDEAFIHVERMIQGREAWTVCLCSFSWWDPMRNDSRFNAVLDRLSFPASSRVHAEARARRAAGRSGTLG